MLRTFPGAAGEGLSGAVFTSRDITLNLAELLGPHALRTFGFTAQAPHSTVAALWAAVLAASPRFIYVCGGYSDDPPARQALERLSLDTGRWERLPSPRRCRGGAAAALLAGQVYVCGGCVDYHAVLDSVECFDPGKGAWVDAPAMTTARQGAAVLAVRDCLYVCGGWGAGDVPLSCAEVFVRRAAAWRPADARLRESRAWAGAGAIGDRLYICGGQNKHDPLRSAECLLVAPASGAPDQAAAVAALARAPMPVPPMRERRSAPAAAAAAGCLYVCGGWDEHRQNLRSVERYDPKEGTWETMPPMLVKRFGAAACAAPAEGRLYVFGGYEEDDVDACLASAECYDVCGTAWSPVCRMGTARSGAVAVVGLA